MPGRRNRLGPSPPCPGWAARSWLLGSFLGRGSERGMSSSQKFAAAAKLTLFTAKPRAIPDTSATNTHSRPNQHSPKHLDPSAPSTMATPSCGYATKETRLEWFQAHGIMPPQGGTGKVVVRSCRAARIPSPALTCPNPTPDRTHARPGGAFSPAPCAACVCISISRSLPLPLTLCLSLSLYQAPSPRRI